MMSVKLPTTVILLKKPKRLYEDRFVFTYEYGWSEVKSSSASKENKSQQVTDANLCMPADCSWDNIDFRFTVNQKHGVTS
jgi:hypothetical protein